MHSTPNASYDLLFTNATVVDGTNTAPFAADVAIQDDRIVAIGDLASATATRVIDVGQRVLAPGFIDAHTHDDNVLLRRNDMTPKVSQGVTTVVAGNCGISIAPLRHPSPPPPLDLLGQTDSYVFDTFTEYLEALDDQPAAINATCLLGHSTVRAATMSRLDRTATPAEITAMQNMVDDALQAGAIGVSTGIFYPTARAATTEEIIEVCRPLSDHKALYTTHMRDESDEVIASLHESFQIGRELGVRVIISHHKVTGKQNFGRSVETLALISDYMQKQDIGLDVYPYTAASTILEASMAKLASRVMVTWCVPFPEYTGRDLADIAKEQGWTLDEAVEALSPAGGIYFVMDEADVQRIMKFDTSMIGSDGLPQDAHPHPRLWGTFPRVLGHYSRDLGLFPLQTAIWKMTGLTAERFGLDGRGIIREGAYADLVIFDPDTIAETATFEAPASPSAGIDAVYVNGVQAWDGKAGHTGARSGRVLRAGANFS